MRHDRCVAPNGTGKNKVDDFYSCGSYAINVGHQGRKDEDLHLCNVCYWRKKANGFSQEELDYIEHRKLLG